MKKNSHDKNSILDEILENATELPVESQNLLLILAKGMAFTRYCITNENVITESSSDKTKGML